MAKKYKSEIEQRSYNMSRIKSKNTRLELILRKALWAKGIRYRKNYKLLPGNPDIAITKYKIVVFVDGEFWHGKDWNSKKMRIQNNRDYWVPKIERNIKRDIEINRLLQVMGWRVLRFWGCDIGKNVDLCAEEIRDTVFQVKLDVFDYLNETNDYINE